MGEYTLGNVKSKDKKSGAKRHQKPRLALILHNIRSAHNVGSLFRSADGAGAEKLYLSGYTPAPEDRFVRPNLEIKKTALGAERSVSWSAHTTVANAIAAARREGFSIVAVEQHVSAVLYTKYRLTRDTAFMLGNEVRGLSSEALKKADRTIHIPMHGKKESLNVSVAGGIVLFHARTSST